MLAKQTDKAFDDPDWLYEIKWDGYRAISETGGKKIRLYSRNGNDFTDIYPVVTEALQQISHTAILDGEIVLIDENGLPDFQKLQQYEENTHLPLHYYIFDLLSLDGNDLFEMPLIDRKQLLKTLLPKSPVLKFSDHIIKDGISFFNASTEKKLEGIMAKKMDSHYYCGKRSSEWLKIKDQKTAEAIIVGFTKPTGGRTHFGSLVLAIKKAGKLVHAGQVGTGFDVNLLKSIYKLLKPLVNNESPFEEKPSAKTKITWVKPQLVCEIKFTAWTEEGRFRHPVFMHLRNDKNMMEVNIKQKEMLHKKTYSNKSVPDAKVKTASKKKAVAVLDKTLLETKEKTNYEIRVGKITVPISNPQKLYWPKEKITKKMLVDYYQSIADYILPFLKDRPQSLKRNPNGIVDKGFYHKDAGEGAPDFVKSFAVHSESSNKEIDYILCNDKATLAYLNNLGCIELNPWHSTHQKPSRPDYLIIDIDPSEKNNFDQVIETAQAFKKLLDKAGAKGFCKTSGASGLHIYLPMKKKYDYETVKKFAHLLCVLVNQMLPEITTLERNLKKRGNKKIYLDYLQNNSGQTICSVYSIRPRPGATVSMPLEWKEVKKGLSPMDFSIHNALQKIKKSKADFKGILGPATNIVSGIKNLEKSS